MAFVFVFVMVASAFVAFADGGQASSTASTAAPALSSNALPAGVASSAYAKRSLKLGWLAMAIGTTNPIHITLDDEYVIVYNVYSTLITYNATYAYEPDIAQKWWVYNSTAYELYLTPNAYWTDPRNPSDTSHRVTGYDVKWSYETFSNNVGDMDLFSDYVREIRSVWVDPANQFHIRVDFKIPYAPALETFGTVFILPEYIWATAGLSYSNPLPIGSGPFMVRPDPAHPDKMLKPPPVLYLDRNPNWHGPSALGWQIFPDTLEVDSYTTSAAMSQDLVLGVIDAVMSPEPTEWVYYLANKPGIIRQSVPHAFVAEVGINLMTPDLRATDPQRFRGSNSQLLQNDVVRVAIQMITNRQKMIKNALLGLGEPADTLVPTVSPWHYDFPDYSSTMPAWKNQTNATMRMTYMALEEFPDDTDAPGTQSSTYLARALLMREGWKYTSAGAPATLSTTPLCKEGGKDCLVFRFYTLSDANWWKTAADGMVTDAAKAGIQLNLALYGTTQMNNQIWWPMDYDIWLWDWMFTPAADPATGILSVETCENLIHGSANDNGFCLRDPTDGHWIYDDLFNASIRTTDLVERRKITDEMQKILYRYGGYNLPFYREEIYAMNTLRWTNWGDWAKNPALPEDVGLNTLLGGQVWPQDHKPPQVANLSKYQGVVNTPVKFSATATDPNGIALTYTWDFADARLEDDTNHDGIWNNDPDATGANAEWTYTAPGQYNVTLWVRETGPGAEWLTRKNTTVTIYPASSGSPVVTGVTFGPELPTTIEDVAFAVAAFDPQGQEMSYVWNFGDGTTFDSGTSPVASHRFSAAAVRTVQVTAKAGAAEAQGTTIVQVVVNTAPEIQPIPKQQVDEGTIATLSVFAQDANLRDTLNYTWNFDDGSAPGYNSTTTHIWAVKGNAPTDYYPTVTITDFPPGSSTYLHSVTASTQVTVIPKGPDRVPVIYSFTADPDPAWTTNEITFVLSARDGEGDPLRWSIDFDCGAQAAKCNPTDMIWDTEQSRPNLNQTFQFTWTYTVSKTYLIGVFVDDGAGQKGNVSTTMNLVVSANNAPTLDAILAAPSTPIPGQAVTLSSLSADVDRQVLDYQWNFGDSSAYVTGTTPLYGGLLTTTHTYPDAGSYTIVLQVNDRYGGTAERQFVLDVVQQNVPPTVSAITGPVQAQSGTTVTYHATVDDLNGDTLTYTWTFGDGATSSGQTTGVPEIVTGTHSYTVTTDTTFHVGLSVDDAHGGVVQATTFDILIKVAAVVDVTPPVTTATPSGTLGSNDWYTSAVTVTLDATDDISAIPWTNYSLDGGAWTPYSAPFAISADGTHTVEYNSTDAVGNDEVSHTATVKVDRTPPAMTDSESGTTAGAWYVGTVTVTLTPSDGASGVAAKTYRIDGAGWQVYSGPFTIASEGRHVVDYQVTDFAGLAFANAVNVYIDLSAPVTTAGVAGNAGTNGWYTTSLIVTLNAVDTFSAVHDTWYRLDAADWTPYASAFSVTGEGSHTLLYNSTDNANHAESTVSASLKIDTVAPATTAGLAGTQSGGWYGTTVTVTLTASDATSGVASTEYQLDTTTWSPYTAPVTVTTEGNHAFAYRSTDSAGLVEATNSATIHMDMSAPSTMVSLSGTAGANGWYTSAVTVTLTATDTLSGTAGVRFRVDGGSWSTYSAAFPLNTEGAHTVEYNASDSAGNAETVKTATVKIDTTAPSATLTPSGTAGNAGWYTSAVSVAVAGTDATSGVATREYRIDAGSWQTTTGTFNVPEGTHAVDVRVTDAAGLVSSVQSATLKIDATKPILSGLKPTGTVSTSSVTIYWTGADSGSGIAEYKVAVDGGAATSTGTTNSTALTLADGAHTIVVTATDTAGNTVSETLTLTVSTAVAPSGGLDTMTIIVIVVVVAAAALGAVWFLMRRKKAGPPS